jgi:protein-tyrosine kinase
MSRIHDALKRAEQERATSLGTHVEPSFEQPDSEQMPMPSLQSTSSSGMQAASDFNYEALLSRCRPVAWNPDPTTMLFFQDDETRLGTEEFRTLRSRLYQIREKMPLKRLLVTSAMPKEGKSFVAANLGQVLVRQHGRRALIIDADLRNPGLHRHLGTSSTPGLSE